MVPGRIQDAFVTAHVRPPQMAGGGGFDLNDTSFLNKLDPTTKAPLPGINYSARFDVPFSTFALGKNPSTLENDIDFFVAPR